MRLKQIREQKFAHSTLALEIELPWPTYKMLPIFQ